MEKAVLREKTTLSKGVVLVSCPNLALSTNQVRVLTVVVEVFLCTGLKFEFRYIKYTQIYFLWSFTNESSKIHGL